MVYTIYLDCDSLMTYQSLPMNNDPLNLSTRAILTAVFVGLVTTLLCIVYDTFFRGATGFSPSYFINVSTILFLITPLFMLVGVAYSGFLKIKKGEIIYILLIVLLTAFLSIMAGRIHRSDIPVENTEFHQLLVPLIIIMGLCASIGIPYLFHNKNFEEHVL